MNKVIFCCRTAEEASELASSLVRAQALTEKTPMKNREAILSLFRGPSCDVLCVDQPSIHGWRAPRGVKLFFMDGWPNDPRYRRL